MVYKTDTDHKPSSGISWVHSLWLPGKLVLSIQVGVCCEASWENYGVVLATRFDRTGCVAAYSGDNMATFSKLWT